MSARMPGVSDEQRRALEAFVYREAQLADESRYEEWEALLADDMRYWVPVVTGQGEPDPERDVSIINDNRSRLATRLRQLRAGTRHSQVPVSILRRLISNFAVERLQADDFRVEANFVVYEYQRQSTGAVNTWPGRVEYGIRFAGGEPRMYLKKVSLIHSSGPVPTLSFLI